MKRFFLLFAPVFLGAVFLTSCTKVFLSPGFGLTGITETNGGGGGGGNTQAGVITAGEWNDLNHWTYWGVLINSNNFNDKPKYWGFYTNHRIAVKVVNESGNPIAGAKVELLPADTDKPLWTAVTDRQGLANCWAGLYSDKGKINSKDLFVSINGDKQKEHPVIMTLPTEASSENLESPTDEGEYNIYTINSLQGNKNNIDVAFVVDATGSMGDEIAFLKEDLKDIIQKSSQNALLRTAAVFYRDEEDDYITKVSPFTENHNTTVSFVSEQAANGGGDYPEAVHSALEASLQELSWSEQATCKLMFLFLDAPAHHNNDVINSLHKSVQAFAKNGIKIIPVAASGTDDNTEFMSRFFAIATGGTYVFITNDSGVGNDHIKAKVGNFQVEQLNALIIRLIKYYSGQEAS